MNSDHVRNTAPMQASRRCGARARSGRPCRAPAVGGKSRCRMHGGAARTGAPRGNRNAQTHGMFTSDSTAERENVRTVLDQARKLLRELSRTDPDVTATIDRAPRGRHAR
ncbi:HGGxSTG domain-containing protein [Bradyrhizobium cosmicum]|uniref:HGGxSTG domain-containing protein n=1 Tax=Bradyrhizobium cosmicum TaxID=1404864 RepID=UPI0028E4078C|nr:HGGxSTG domain-containing protein [Bradyrhizobium cosmicum]